MSVRLTVFIALVAIVSCSLAAETKTYHETLTPKGLSEWRDSRDGKISACFAVDKTTFDAKEPLRVRCAVRNNSDRPLTLLRPYGDIYYAHSSGITILGPDGAVPYRGAVKDYLLGTSSFLELQAHTVVEETIELPTDRFPGLGKSGLYRISYVFWSGGYPKQPVPENYWQGQIKTSSLTIMVR